MKMLKRCLIMPVMMFTVCAEEVVHNEVKSMPPTNVNVNVVSQIKRPPPLHLTDILSYLTIHVRSYRGQVPVTGTGFFFTFRIKDKRGLNVPALVTNKHVVLGYTGTTLRFTVAQNGRPTDRSVEFQLNRAHCLWYAHPDSDVDICALPILPIIDHFKKQGIELFISPLNHTFVADDVFLQNITQLDDVVMIGYPDGIWDQVNNQPIFRKGVFATKPDKKYNGKREFVIDMPVYGGSSGSPVLIASDGPWVDRSHGHSLMTRAPTKIVGIVYKTFVHNDLGQLIAVPIPTVAADRNNAALIRVPNNLGLVISASRLLEMEDLFTSLWGQREEKNEVDEVKGE